MNPHSRPLLHTHPRNHLTVLNSETTLCTQSKRRAWAILGAYFHRNGPPLPSVPPSPVPRRCSSHWTEDHLSRGRAAASCQVRSKGTMGSPKRLHFDKPSGMPKPREPDARLVRRLRLTEPQVSRFLKMQTCSFPWLEQTLTSQRASLFHCPLQAAPGAKGQLTCSPGRVGPTLRCRHHSQGADPASPHSPASRSCPVSFPQSRTHGLQTEVSGSAPPSRDACLNGPRLDHRKLPGQIQ